MKFIEFNINPKNKRTKDCVIRAIATATNSSWEYIYRISRVRHQKRTNDKCRKL